MGQCHENEWDNEDEMKLYMLYRLKVNATATLLGCTEQRGIWELSGVDRKRRPEVAVPSIWRGEDFQERLAVGHTSQLPSWNPRVLRCCLHDGPSKVSLVILKSLLYSTFCYKSYLRLYIFERDESTNQKGETPWDANAVMLTPPHGRICWQDYSCLTANSSSIYSETISNGKVMRSFKDFSLKISSAIPLCFKKS